MAMRARGYSFEARGHTYLGLLLYPYCSLKTNSFSLFSTLTLIDTVSIAEYPPCVTTDGRGRRWRFQ